MLRILRISLLIPLLILIVTVWPLVFNHQETASTTHEMRIEPTPKPQRHINYFTDEQDQRLVQSATERVQCISSGTCEFSHDGWTGFITPHLNYSKAGEVLARDFENWNQVMSAWYASESHNKVLMGEWCMYGAARSGDVFVLLVACEQP